MKLLIILILLLLILGYFFIQYIRNILEIHSLSRQLEEIERGSHIELTTQNRQKHLLKLCRQLNRLQKFHDQNQIRYEKAEKQLKQNITSLAHDIRTPLTGATGYIQLAQESFHEMGQQTHYLQAAENRMKELEHMLEELFLYTKLTSEEFELAMQKVQVLPLLSDCLVGLYWKFEEKKITPEIFFESEGICIQADEEALRRIFHNLIQNALLHGTGGIIIHQKTILLKEDHPPNSSTPLSSKQYICLTFENTISKTSKPDPNQIFERFYKADSSRQKGSSGLGLFIVKELTEKMNGTIKAELNEETLKIILMFHVKH